MNRGGCIKIRNFKCPRCHNPNIIQIKRNTWKCPLCGYTWTEGEEEFF